MRGILVFILLFPLLACGKDVKDIAVVNGSKLTVDDYNSFVKMHNAHPYETADAKERQTVIATMVKRELLTQAALARKIEQHPEFTKEFERNKQRFAGQEESLKKMLLLNFMFQQIAGTPEFEDVQLKKVYEQDAKKYAQDYQVRHILTANEQDAQAVLRQLQAGKPFALLAASTSMDISKRRSGELGWVSAAALPDAFDEALSGGNGVYKKPLKSDFGWHVIEITSSRPVPVASYDEVKERYKQDKINAHIESLLAQLEKKAAISYPQ